MSPPSSTNIIPFHQRVDKKLIPIDAHFNGVIHDILVGALSRFNVDNMALQYRCVSNEDSRYFFTGMDDVHIDDGNVFQMGHECVQTQNSVKNRVPGKANLHSVVMPVTVNGHHSGNVIALSASHHNVDELSQSLSTVISEITNLIKRYLIRDTVIQHYAETQYWIGRSFELRQLEALIEKLAPAYLPIVICGENGTGKMIAARALHCHRFSGSAPFIECHCVNWRSSEINSILNDLVSRCYGGTVFLRSIDKLSADDFLALQVFLQSKEADDKHYPFFITSVTDPIDRNHPVFNWMEFDAIVLRLPNLRERKRDIKDLAQCFIQEYADGKALALSDEAYCLLEEFEWPENVSQLQRMLKKIVVMADQSLIETHRLLSWFPSLKKPVACSVPLEQLQEFNVIAFKSPSLTVKPLAVERVLSDHSLSVNYLFGVENLDNEHPALIKAIDYILHHFQEPITMADVAGRACISASHLSYLFKCRLQRSFKQVMTEIRIDKAKYFFQKLPSRQITQVSSDVGFSDLSHFEKTFKRMVGISPRAYRNQFRPPLSTAT